MVAYGYHKFPGQECEVCEGNSLEKLTSGGAIVAEQQEGALSGYRVLDLADTKGVYAGKLLADLGADVIKVEDPQGDPTRKIPPFVDDIPHHEKSLYFLYRNANKRGITLNLEVPDGKSIFKKLVKTADVLLETYPPGYMASLGLDYGVLSKLKPDLIMASITDFGQTGPHKDWKGSDIVHFALSGAMLGCGFPDKPPCTLPGSPSYDSASLIASTAIIVALYSRGITGEGQYIETSALEATQIGIQPWAVTGVSPKPEVAQTERRSPGRTGVVTYPLYPCKDGWIRVTSITPRQWDALRRTLGNPEVLESPDWYSINYRVAYADSLFAIIQEYTTQYTVAELFDAADKEGFPSAPVYNVPDFVNSPQTKARGFFVEVDHPVAGKALYPGSPYKLTETPCSIRRPAPCLGEHNEEIYCKELGFSKDELVALRRAGVV